MGAQHILTVALVAAICTQSYGSAIPQQKHEIPAIYKHLFSQPHSKIESTLKAILSPTMRSAIDDQIIAFIEKLRAGMGAPNPDFGLPALDPLVISHFDIDLNEEIATLNGAIDNVTVTKLSSFIINSIKLNLLGLSFSFGFTLPELNVVGQYDIDGVAGGVLPIYGNGPFSVSLANLTLDGTIKIGVNNTFIYIKSFDLDFTLQQLKVHFDGLLGGGDISDVLNEVINDMLPGLIEDNKATLIETITDSIVNLVNQNLVGVTIQDLLDLIAGAGQRGSKFRL